MKYMILKRFIVYGSRECCGIVKSALGNGLQLAFGLAPISYRFLCKGPWNYRTSAPSLQFGLSESKFEAVLGITIPPYHDLLGRDPHPRSSPFV
jgi:hypothetical protein